VSGTTDATRRVTRHDEMVIKAAANDRMDVPDLSVQTESKRQISAEI